MSDDFDILKQASKALREEGEPAPEDVRRLRSRVIEGVRVQQRRRSKLFTLAFPIAAVLVATTAWAAGTGRLGLALRGVRALFVPEPVATLALPPAPAPLIIASAPPKPVEPAPVASNVEPPPVAAPEPPPVVVAPSAKPSTSAAPSSVAAPEPPAVEPPVEDAGSQDLALYKKAHKLHFVDKDPAAALVAWDDYLKASPNGAFVAEARYNRAICLVKLGRKVEAKAALQPFADGQIAGGYHKDDARKLIEALHGNEAP